MTGLELIPADLNRRSVDLPGIEGALRSFIEMQSAPDDLQEAQRRLDGAAGYYDKESPEWHTAQRLLRRVEKRMAEIRNHGYALPVKRKILLEWDLFKDEPDLFEEALAKKRDTRRQAVIFIEEHQARRIKPAMPDEPDDLRGDGWQLLRGDATRRLAELPEASIDLIVTDPPYPAKFTHLWDELAALAFRLLRPDGIVVALCGKIALAERIAQLTRGGLTYGWMYAEPLVRGNTRILARHVLQEWKPWLAFTKGTWPSGRIDWHGDLLPSTKEKGFRWQQGVESAEFLIQHLSHDQATVLDPFAGHATYGVAALRAGRHFIGCEADPDRFRAAADRLGLATE